MHNDTSVTSLLFHSEANISLSLFLKKQFQQVLNRLLLKVFKISTILPVQPACQDLLH